MNKGEIAMEVTKIIGLAEEQRKIYRHLENHGVIDTDFHKSYVHHQKGLESLIKYQATLQDENQ